MSRSASTIFALSTVPGRSGVAVIRISGPQAGAVLDAMAPPRPAPREAAFRTIRHPLTREVLDRAVVLYFPRPKSETGEDVAELQVHGGPAVIRSVLNALSTFAECRMAEPGEFARRAFHNGKLDLAQAEGLADLVAAETEGQRRQALRQAGGALSRLYEQWRTQLIEASALAEAAIDFSDEGDAAEGAFEAARQRVQQLQAAISQHLHDGHRGEILRDGFRVVLAGPPNAGKSSLLNALARRPAAIVSEEAGTTRDVIEVMLDLDGLPVILSDTAGLREAQSAVELEGIRRSLDQVRGADLVVWLMDALTPVTTLPAEVAQRGPATLAVLNKIDLVKDGPRVAPPGGALGVSALTGAGIPELMAKLAAIASDRVGNSPAPAITQVRHRQLVEQCAACLGDFMQGDASQIELRAEDLRRATYALGRITGRVDVEDVLDQVFSRFCIGK